MKQGWLVQTESQETAVSTPIKSSARDYQGKRDYLLNYTSLPKWYKMLPEGKEDVKSVTVQSKAVPIQNIKLNTASND